MILINHASTPIRKKRLSPSSKARKEASRNQSMEKGGMPDCRKKSRRDGMMRSKSFEMQEVREIGRKEAGDSR